MLKIEKNQNHSSSFIGSPIVLVGALTSPGRTFHDAWQGLRMLCVLGNQNWRSWKAHQDWWVLQSYLKRRHFADGVYCVAGRQHERVNDFISAVTSGQLDIGKHRCVFAKTPIQSRLGPCQQRTRSWIWPEAQDRQIEAGMQGKLLQRPEDDFFTTANSLFRQYSSYTFPQGPVIVQESLLNQSGPFLRCHGSTKIFSPIRLLVRL